MTVLRKCSVLLIVGVVASACATRSSGPSLLAEDPAETVAAFLNAAEADDVRTMARLWGTASRGPAADWMDPEVAQQRLVVMARFLDHESFEILAEPTLATERARERTVRVRILRSGCRPVVPFHLVRRDGGWIIDNIDLAAAGSPTEVCGR